MKTIQKVVIIFLGQSLKKGEKIEETSRKTAAKRKTVKSKTKANSKAAKKE